MNKIYLLADTALEPQDDLSHCPYIVFETENGFVAYRRENLGSTLEVIANGTMPSIQDVAEYMSAWDSDESVGLSYSYQPIETILNYQVSGKP